jgi:peptidyl-prolyl cis-trans isomerase C
MIKGHFYKPILRTLPLMIAMMSASVNAEDATPTANNPLANPETVIATINGVSYPLDVFRVFYNERLQQSQAENTPELQEKAFNEFLKLVVAAQEAKKRGLEQEREVQAALQLQQLAILSAAALQTMAAEATPSEAELAAEYEKFVENSQREEYKARHILVDTEEKARDLIAQLDAKKGQGFAELAKENSLGPTAEKGGDLGWFDGRRMVKPFSDAVAAMKPGQYSKDPVKTQFGWHVILLEETRMAEPPTLEEAKPQLEASIRRAKVLEKLAALFNQATIELNEEVVRKKDSAATAE